LRFWILLGVILGVTACNRDMPDETIPSSIIERGEPEAGAGLYSSLAVDADGRIHAAYFHADLATLRHAVWSEGRWQIASVEAPEDRIESGRHARITAHGTKLYIAYQKRTFEDAARERLAGEQVWLASSADGESWTTEAVDTSSLRTGEFIGLAVQQGQPVVAYFESTNGDLMLARRDGSTWEISAVDHVGDVGRYVSLEVGRDELIHLAYYDASRGALRYAVEKDGAFEITDVDGFAAPPTTPSDERDAGTWAQLRVAPAGAVGRDDIQPKIAYFDETSRTLRLAESQDGAWKLSQIDDQVYAGTDASFLWMRDDTLVVAYFDGYSLDAKLARRTAGGWSHQTVLTQGAVGMYNALVDIGEGKVAMTTYDLSRGALHFLLLPVRP
jgi:hypothetical protein